MCTHFVQFEMCTCFVYFETCTRFVQFETRTRYALVIPEPNKLKCVSVLIFFPDSFLLLSDFEEDQTLQYPKLFFCFLYQWISTKSTVSKIMHGNMNSIPRCVFRFDKKIFLVWSQIIRMDSKDATTISKTHKILCVYHIKFNDLFCVF